MKILYYMPRCSAGDLLADYTDCLVSALADKATVIVASSQKEAIDRLRSERPDILHVHHCWRCLTASVLREARRQGVATVLSPHHQLAPYALRHEHRLEKQVRRLAYERRTVMSYDALLVTSDRERQQLLDSHWHDRIDVVRPATLTAAISPEDMAQQMLAFYRKVMDTRYQLLMTEEEHLALETLLHVGTLHDSSRRQVSHERILQLRSLTPAAWRRIMLMADDEDITGAVTMAIEVMQIEMPDINAQAIDRFPLRHPKTKGSLPRKLLIVNPLRKSKIKEELDEQPQELQLVITDIINAETLLREHHLSLRHLSELFETLRYTDFDEDELQIALHHLGLKRFAERLTAVLATLLSLDEGYQPTDLRTDKTTRRYIQQITNRINACTHKSNVTTNTSNSSPAPSQP